MSALGALAETRRAAELGARALELAKRLYPLARSITGPGVRESLQMIAERAPVEIVEVPSGTAVLDWEIPPEWSVREAYIADARGRRIVDVAEHNLHLVGYSRPFRGRLPLQELQRHLHSLPAHPDAIPYRTGYYRDDWGFCVRHSLRERLEPGLYDVVVDTVHAPGSLTYAEVRVRGELPDEVLISTHTCHPSLANDNCTGMAVLAILAEALSAASTRLSYRLVFAPGTIGSIAWLARNEVEARRIRAGLVIGLLGDPGPLTYKRSRRGDTEIDRIAAAVIGSDERPGRIEGFSPYGYDERQYCSPGFDLPVGRLTRSPNEAYPQYHTSDDDLTLISAGSLAGSIAALCRILQLLDDNRRLASLAPDGEPWLGRRGLFRPTGGQDPSQFEHALLWILNQADGEHGVLDIAPASGFSVDVLESAATALEQAGLIRREAALRG